MGKDALSAWGYVEDLLEGIPHVVAGGMAVNQFAPPRFTEDFDIAVTASAMPTALEALTRANFEIEGTLPIGGYSLRSPHSSVIDLILLEAEWAEEALSHPHIVGVFPVLAAPYLLLLKMEASRASDIGDLQRILHGLSPTQRDNVRRVFRRLPSMTWTILSN